MKSDQGDYLFGADALQAEPETFLRTAIAGYEVMIERGELFTAFCAFHDVPPQAYLLSISAETPANCTASGPAIPQMPQNAERGDDQSRKDHRDGAREGVGGYIGISAAAAAVVEARRP